MSQSSFAQFISAPVIVAGPAVPTVTADKQPKLDQALQRAIHQRVTGCLWSILDEGWRRGSGRLGIQFIVGRDASHRSALRQRLRARSRSACFAMRAAGNKWTPRNWRPLRVAGLASFLTSVSAMLPIIRTPRIRQALTLPRHVVADRRGECAVGVA
jgi:hypothetical protein